MADKLTTAQSIAESVKAINDGLKTMGSEVSRRQPQVGFQGSKATIIDPRISDKPKAVKPYEKYKNQNLFKVGLLFATGEMNKYYTIKGNNEIVLNNGLSPLKIAKELGNPSFEKIILASKNNYKTGENKNKNIFNNLDMMTKIISDCEAKNITVEPYFISRLPIE